jgi:hypothetical protein
MNDMSGPAIQSRRAFLASLTAIAAGVGAASVGAAPLPAQARRPSAARAITVYKDPNCGCCSKWIDHLKAAGFTPTVHDTTDMSAVKASMGVPKALESCHTARVGAYTIEGHVPADVITKLLAEKPAGVGLAVPGMPAGSPGMEMGGRKDPYDVMLFDKAGKSRVYVSR